MPKTKWESVIFTAYKFFDSKELLFFVVLEDIHTEGFAAAQHSLQGNAALPPAERAAAQMRFARPVCAVAPPHAPARFARHTRKTAHADSADADKVEGFHPREKCARRFTASFGVVHRYRFHKSFSN